MKHKAISITAMVIMLFLLYLYSTLYASSILYDDTRSIISIEKTPSDLTSVLERPNNVGSFFYDTYIRSPFVLELYIRASLLSEKNNKGDLLQYYNRLLKSRPTWPYYFSGIAHIKQLSNDIDFKKINQAMLYGHYEKNVIYSLAELLFYQWDEVAVRNRESVLQMLINQEETKISNIVNISAKYAKIYQYCDFIYEQKQLEYRACIQNYWQPLTD